MGRNTRWIWAGLFLIYPALLWGMVVPFSPQNSPTWVDPFWAKPGQESGYVFHNPAGLFSVVQPQLTASSGGDYLGYTPFIVTGVFEREDLKFGVGMLRFAANDAIKVNETSDRPVNNGVLTHQFTLTTVSIAKSWRQLSIGFSAVYEAQQLDTQGASKWSFDPGIMWSAPSWWVGIYTQNLLTSSLKWDHVIEAVSPICYVEFGALLDWGTLVAETSFQTHRLRAEWALHPMFSLTGDTVFSSGLSLKRYSYGSQLTLNDFSIHYLRSVNPFDNFPIYQDIFGVSFRF